MKAQEHSLDFYKALANIFYAVSMSDGRITREEKLKIIEYVKKYWTEPVKNTESNVLIYQTLRTLIKNNVKPQSAFLAFKAFYLNNKEMFYPELLAHILKACNAITSSFGKQNKSELIILTSLSLLFKS